MPSPRNVVVVAPVFRENTLRYLRAFAELPAVRLGVVSQEPAERLEPELRARLSAHYRVADCADPQQLAQAARAIAGALGPLDGIHAFIEQLQLEVAEVRAALGIPGMGPDTIRGFRDKARMKEVLRKAGLPCARSLLCESAAAARRFVGEVGFPVVAKPRAGVGSRGTWTIADADALEAALAQAPPDALGPWQLEEFVAGEERTCETWSVRGEPRWSTGTFYVPRPLEVLENPWMQYTVLLPREDDADFTAFRPVNAAALGALGMQTGLTHMEWFRAPSGRHVISEVAARPPGVMVMPMLSRACGVDMISAWARLVVHEELEPPVRRYACGVAFFRGQGRGERVAAVHGLDAANEEVGALVVDRSLPTPGQPRAAGYEGEGWAMLRHPDTEVVRSALRRLVTLVRVEMG